MLIIDTHSTIGDDSNHSTKNASNLDEHSNKVSEEKNKKSLYSIDNYTFGSPRSKVARGHVRSMCNLFDNEIKERESSPVKSSARNVGKLPGFEDYPSRNRSLEDGNRGFARKNRGLLKVT